MLQSDADVHFMMRINRYISTLLSGENIMHALVRWYIDFNRVLLSSCTILPFYVLHQCFLSDILISFPINQNSSSSSSSSFTSSTLCFQFFIYNPIQIILLLASHILSHLTITRLEVEVEVGRLFTHLRNLMWIE